MAEEIKIVGLANPKRSVGVSFKIIGAIVGIIVLALGVMAGIYLVGQSQDIREEAARTCPEIEACPSADEPDRLINCTPTEEHSRCTSGDVGRLEMCGGREYCCNGTSWSSNLSSCAVSTPSPSPTASASPNPTRSPSPTPTTPGSTATAVPTSTAGGTTSPTRTPTTTPTTTSVSQATSTSSSAQATAVPIPETGASWQTILGGGIGLVVILASLVLAL